LEYLDLLMLKVTCLFKFKVNSVIKRAGS
jgi:hypothetical protein